MSSSITRYFPASLRESLDSTITAAEAVQENSIRIETLRTQPPCSESTISDAPVEHVAPALGVEEELIFRVCGGDNEALTFLFRRYARLVRSVAYRVLRDPFEADDLLQEVFLMLPRKCSSFDSSKGSARVWILQIAYHLAISRRRHLSSRHFYTGVELEDAERSGETSRGGEQRFEELIAAALAKPAIEEVFALLSENQRQTLRLYFFEGYSFDEIAAQLGQTKDNVRHHYFRGLDKMRKQIFRKPSGSRQ
jgi:RNA polymerase sigma-70 factor, ECF subfamily